jgi:hypothetical protein
VSNKSTSSVIQSKAGKPLWTTTDLFNRRLFIENKGQFDGKNNIPESTIKDVVCEQGACLDFKKASEFEFTKADKVIIKFCK